MFTRSRFHSFVRAVVCTGSCLYGQLFVRACARSCERVFVYSCIRVHVRWLLGDSVRWWCAESLRKTIEREGAEFYGATICIIVKEHHISIESIRLVAID